MSNVPNPARDGGGDFLDRDDQETGAALPEGVEGQPVGRHRPDPSRRQLSAKVLAALDERRWDDMLDAAQELYAHEVPEDDTIREAMGALRSIERQLRHGIYSTAVGAGAAVIMCDCRWTVEKATLGQARAEHRLHREAVR